MVGRAGRADTRPWELSTKPPGRDHRLQRGAQPEWLREKLKAGAKIEDFAVNKSVTPRKKSIRKRRKARRKR